MNVPIQDTLIFLSDVVISDSTTISIYPNSSFSWFSYIQDDIEVSTLLFVIVYGSDKHIPHLRGCPYVKYYTLQK